MKEPAVSDEPIEMSLTEDQWVLVGSLIGTALKNPQEGQSASDLEPIARKIGQTLNRRMRDAEGRTPGVDVIFNFTGTRWRWLNTEEVYGEEEK